MNLSQQCFMTELKFRIHQQCQSSEAETTLIIFHIQNLISFQDCKIIIFN